MLLQDETISSDYRGSGAKAVEMLRNCFIYHFAF